MRTCFAFLLALAIPLALTGCGDKAGGGSGSSIVGTWVFDKGTAATDADGKVNAAFEMALKMMPKMEVEYVFAADGTFSMKQHVLEKEPALITGAWEAKDGKYVVTEKTKDGKPRRSDDKYNAVTMEMKDGELQFNPPGAPIVFHLKRK